MSLKTRADERVEHLHQMLDDAEAEIVDHPISPDRFFYLRPSGFPYCGLRKLLTAPSKIEDGETSDLAGAYFTGVGTEAHTIFQSHVGRLGEVVGDWTCKHCGKSTWFSTFKICDCGHKPVYRELAIRYRKTVVGHLDGLVRLRKRKKGKRRYIVIDYKTATGNKIEKGRTDETIFPYQYNVHQIKRYVVLMELCFGICVDGWALIYLNRDVPLGRKNRKIIYREVSPKEKSELVDEIEKWIRIHRRVLVARTRKDFDYIKDNKLCASHEDYKKNWENPYSPCPCLPYCFNSTRLEKVIDQRLGNKTYPMINLAPRAIREGLEIKRIRT